ncbi:AMP-binding protein [Sansalvadorimonas sp. 2012CJ34-2]|uniref:AMP-binding protein n=1 Tax=Parendozoicomonas callyspongiae TaxID=2942213 RepID=A0ABT0PJF2_9GAMM|nr:AMP-binding protein [Sansalvadorimonas sp. 2012CJ34-2]MCL6271517.1 AMP-binding protein [Sansalvadorimonas sp. 2012CJ34-2]
MGDPVTSLELSSSQKTAGSSYFSSVQQMLEYCFDMYCHFPALCSDKQTLSYSQLDEASTSFAAFVQTSLDIEKDVVAVTSRPSISSAIALCGALKSGASVAVVEPDYFSQAGSCFSHLKVRLVVAEKSDFFHTRYLNRFFQPEQQVLDLNAQGQVSQARSFNRIVRKTPPKIWARPASRAHRTIKVFQIGNLGKVEETTQNDLLSQVESLYREIKNSEKETEMPQVASFLKLLVQLLRGKPLSMG